LNHSLRAHLFLNGLAITLLGMGLAGFLVWRAAEKLYIETQTENLLAQARLAASALQGQPLPAAGVEPYYQTTNVQPGMHTRVLGKEGAVIINIPLTPAGTAVQVPSAENSAPVAAAVLLQRPEIAAALQGEAASAVRKVLAEKRRVLYAAAPIYDQNGIISGLVYLAVPLPRGGLPASFLMQLAGAGLAAGALVLLAGTLLARRITEPVSAITSAAAAVSGGNLNQDITPNSGIKEVDQLGKAFNRMTASLRQSDQAQNAFVADVAHELRTPLTVIKGTIETLEDGALDDMEGRGPLLVSMERETERLIRLVNDLLTLTRADAGMLKLESEPVDLESLVRQRCSQLAPLASSRGVTFAIKVEGTPCVAGDEDRLAQVLDNLLDNAVRYSPAGAEVTLEAEPGGKETCCSVRDSGPGIPPEHLAHIFERFYRVEPSRNRQSGGAGLGLAIARALVMAQGGNITVDSEPGCGTTFRFCLPTFTDCHIPA